MKRFLTFMLMLSVTISALAQNGGQAPENSSVKLEFAGFNQTRLYNKQSCEAIIQVKYNGTTTNYTVPANGNILFSTPVVGKITAKTTTNCGSADFGLVELNLTAIILPVKFVSFKTKALGNQKVSVEFEIAESVDTDRFNVQLSSNAIVWKTVAIVLPDKLQPNRLYSVIVDLSKQ